MFPSRSHKFNGDPNCLPPECLVDRDNYEEATFAIDSWALGLLTLELITGKRRYLKDKKAVRLANEYVSFGDHSLDLFELVSVE